MAISMKNFEIHIQGEFVKIQDFTLVISDLIYGFYLESLFSLTDQILLRNSSFAHFDNFQPIPISLELCPTRTLQGRYHDPINALTLCTPCRTGLNLFDFYPAN